MLAIEREAPEQPERAGLDVFFALDGGPREQVLALMADLRAPRARMRHRLRGPLAQGPADAGGTDGRADGRDRARDRGRSLRRAGAEDLLVRYEDLPATLTAS